MIKYTDKETACQHLTDRLMESALNNVGIKADADQIFRDIAVNRLPVWIDELQTYDVELVVRCKDCKYAMASSILPTVCVCTHGKGLVDPSKESFCSYGERRADDEES